MVVTAGSAPGSRPSSDVGNVALPAHPCRGQRRTPPATSSWARSAVRLAAGEPLAEALRYANAAAALHVGTPEAERDTLGPADVERLLTGDGGATDGA